MAGHPDSGFVETAPLFSFLKETSLCPQRCQNLAMTPYIYLNFILSDYKSPITHSAKKWKVRKRWKENRIHPEVTFEWTSFFLYFCMYKFIKCIWVCIFYVYIISTSSTSLKSFYRYISKWQYNSPYYEWTITQFILLDFIYFFDTINRAQGTSWWLYPHQDFSLFPQNKYVK